MSPGDGVMARMPWKTGWRKQGPPLSFSACHSGHRRQRESHGTVMPPRAQVPRRGWHGHSLPWQSLTPACSLSPSLSPRQRGAHLGLMQAHVLLVLLFTSLPQTHTVRHSTQSRHFTKRGRGFCLMFLTPFICPARLQSQDARKGSAK